MSRLVNSLIQKRYLRSDLIIDAFWEIKRKDFVPKDLLGASDADIPLPIGYGQTISQPATVAIMLELLDPRRGQTILDIGCGSGWTTALLAYIVGEKGKVVGIERISKIFDFGCNNIKKYGYIEKEIVDLVTADGAKGYPKYAPYDRILVSAMVDEVPVELKRQLKIGGKMVIPVHNYIWFLQKKGEDDFYKEEYHGFSFVPLVEEGPK